MAWSLDLNVLVVGSNQAVSQSTPGNIVFNSVHVNVVHFGDFQRI